MNEIEVKFYIRDPDAILERLLKLGASIVEKRVLEVNLRFDTSKGELRRAKEILRLRRSNDIRLTFKGPSINLKGILERKEIDFMVEDFETARAFLEALGFSVIFKYEKYRTTYTLKNALVMLDELPYGDFIEIEGEVKIIRALTKELNLRNEYAITASYQDLFERIATSMGIRARDLTFEEFSKRHVQPVNLGVQPAD